MKNLKISKELIKAVLEKETETLSKDFNFTINEDYIEFSDDGEMLFEYCIYKFSFKCKEWAFKNEYILTSELTIGKNGYCQIMTKISLIVEREITKHDEVEAIISACEWILSEVNK